MRIVFDTNVIVSALLLSESIPRRAFDKALDQDTILISTPVLLEFAEVLAREKLDKYLREEERMRFLIAFLKETELIEIRERVSDCRDENDNKFLELALSGKADCIISGDDDLLVLNPYRGVSIINPRDFLAGISKW